MFRKSISNEEQFCKCLLALRNLIDEKEPINNIADKLKTDFQEKEVTKLLQDIPKLNRLQQKDIILILHRLFTALLLVFIWVHSLVLFFFPDLLDNIGFNTNENMNIIAEYLLSGFFWGIAYLYVFYNSFIESEIGYILSVMIITIFLFPYDKFIFFLTDKVLLVSIPILLQLGAAITFFILFFKRLALLTLHKRINKCIPDADLLIKSIIERQ